MSKHILVVGASFSDLNTYLRQQGYEYTILHDLQRSKRLAKEAIAGDFSSKEALIANLAKIKKPVDGVITVYENYVLPASWIAKHLGLPGMPIQAAEACTDKFLMRQLFAKCEDKISPDFAIVKSLDDVEKFAATHDFPLILKPANLVKSLLVTKSHNLKELQKNYTNTTAQIAEVYKKYAPHRQHKLIIEEFMEGPIHSVDAFVDSHGTPHVLQEVVDYQTGYDIGYDDNFHYSRLLPSKLSKQQQNELRHVASLGCQALGMKSSPAHIEIIMTKDGPRIVEIGARNGGYRDRMHRLANDISIRDLAFSLVLGQKPNITPSKDEPCAVLELFPKTPGVFTGIKNEAKLQKLSSLVYLSIKVKPGDNVGKAANGHKMCAVVILHNTDSTQFQKDLDFVNNHVYAETN